MTPEGQDRLGGQEGPQFRSALGRAGRERRVCGGWGVKEGSRPGMSVWVGAAKRRTLGSGVSPVGCLMVGVAGGRQEGSRAGAAAGGAAAPGGRRLGVRHGVWGCLAGVGIFWGWGCQEHEGPSPGAQRSSRAGGQRSLPLTSLLAAPQMASAARVRGEAQHARHPECLHGPGAAPHRAAGHLRQGEPPVVLPQPPRQAFSLELGLSRGQCAVLE